MQILKSRLKEIKLFIQNHFDVLSKLNSCFLFLFIFDIPCLNWKMEMSLACHENANEGEPRILKPILSAAGINKWINIFFSRSIL